MAMLTMLSGVAAHERELIRKRSVAGTKRLAEAGCLAGRVRRSSYRKRECALPSGFACRLAACPSRLLPGIPLMDVLKLRISYRDTTTTPLDGSSLERGRLGRGPSGKENTLYGTI